MRVFAFMRDTRGAAAAEMALMLPLLLILMFVGFEAGHYFYTEHKIIKAVREGARFGGRLPFESNGFDCAASGGPTAFIALTDPGLTNVQKVTVYGIPDPVLNDPDPELEDRPRISGWEIDDVTVEYKCDSSITTGLYRYQQSGAPIVRVIAQADYPSLFEQLGLIDSSAIVQASAEAAVMGQ
jgi:hypothetical protein